MPARVVFRTRSFRGAAAVRAGVGGTEGAILEYSWQGSKVIGQINAAVDRALVRAAQDATEYWNDVIWNKEDHPDMTGTERDAGEFVVNIEGSRARLVGRVTLSQDYPIYEEFGTRFREGHFPLRRTMDYIAPRIRDYIRQELAAAARSD